MRMALLLTAALLAGCVSKPEGISPVTNFDVAKYQGKWYEIARFDHRFERAAPAASPKRSSPASNGSQSSTSTPSPASNQRTSPRPPPAPTWTPANRSCCSETPARGQIPL